ncbi:hypothetical protein KC19_5G092600 [Ceratodon purpureus]|uniref:Uncharacterized protein n=1 Tax=Ceratodon purpureus TaxID=3225 RepID=A0A8T0I1X9_CERPU|nr:hypothetical protein KC19_5G092600 [Ceratodon purpureus]
MAREWESLDWGCCGGVTPCEAGSTWMLELGGDVLLVCLCESAAIQSLPSAIALPSAQLGLSGGVQRRDGGVKAWVCSEVGDLGRGNLRMWGAVMGEISVEHMLHGGGVDVKAARVLEADTGDRWRPCVGGGRSTVGESVGFGAE